jgi:hypothetical protein
MAIDKTNKTPNTITLNGVTFKTGGNIVFKDSEDSPFYLAQSSLLEKMDGFLEHGMQLFLKKIGT